MTTYSVIVVDAIGVLIGKLEMDFESDLEAIASIFGADFPQRCELWCGQRFLGLFPAAATLDAPGASAPISHDGVRRFV
ncbi:hypothetical protein LJR164_003022 [Phenylobacterium sp. LjRoot164]|uniref:hypothetical protein n=1 Tax=unclassified Phenylobacterium TaxID=2640670 RepID=UPI003ED096D9